MPASRQSNPLVDANFRRYYTGIWFASSGFWVLKMAIGWAAWQLSESAFWTGLVAASYLLPAFVLCPVLGVLADRVQLKRGLSFTVAALVSLGLMMTAAFALGWLNVQGLALLSIVHGTIAAIYHPMRLTVVARLVDRESIPAVSGLSSIAFNTSRVLGPAIAGVLLAAFGTAETMLVGSLLYLPYLVLLQAVHLRERSLDVAKAAWRAEFIEGLRYAAGFALLLPILAMSALNGVVGRALFELLPVIAGGSLQSGANGLAILTATAGLGAVAAGVVMARVDADMPARIRYLVFAVALTCATTAAVAAAPALLLAAMACGMVGFCSSYAGISSQSILQIALADQYRGRVMSLWTTVSFGAPAMGALLMGAVAELAGVGAAVGGLAVIGFLLSLLAGRWLFSDRIKALVY